MATTIATMSLSSSDILSSAIAFSTTSALSKAGSATGLTKTTGLGRTNFTTGGSAPFPGKVIYRADDATTNGSNKVYLKNISSTATEYFTVFIDQEEMGRLYAGDWAFFPWTATSGTKETFVVTATGTLAAGDSWEFDGIKTTATGTDKAVFATAVNAVKYPNWTTTVSTNAVTFTARFAREDGVITGDAAITGDVLVDLAGSNFTMPITGGTAGAGARSESDIMVMPSVATTIDLEHILLHE